MSDKIFPNLLKSITTAAVCSALPVSAMADTCSFLKVEIRGWHPSAKETELDIRPQRANIGFSISTAAELHGTPYLLKADGAEPYLAKSSSFDDDTNTLTVTLNENCRWSDGEPIIAQDFLTGIEELYNLESKMNLPSLGFLVNGTEVEAGEMPVSALGIEAIDDQTLVYHFEVTENIATETLTLPQFAPLPTHAIGNREEYWSRGNEHNQVFSGPFVVTAVHGVDLDLERNPYFCSDRQVLVDEVKIQFGRELEDQADQMMRQDVDLIGNLTARQRNAFVMHGMPDEYKLVYSHAAAVLWLAFNRVNPAFDDERVRDALRIAFDPTLIDTGMIGVLTHVSDTLTYRYPGYSPEPFPWVDDVEGSAVFQARALMEEAGYSAENPLTLRLSGAPLNEYFSVGAFLQSLYARIHVQVEIIDDDVEGYLERTSEKNGDYDFSLFYWFADYPDPYGYLEAIKQQRFHSVAIEDEFAGLLDAATQANTEQQRLSILAEAENLLIDDGYILPIGVPARAWLTHSSTEYEGAMMPTVRDLTEYSCAE